MPASDVKGVERLATIWRGLTRNDVFPVTGARCSASVARDFPDYPHDGIRKLIEDTSRSEGWNRRNCRCNIVTTTSSPATAWCSRRVHLGPIVSPRRDSRAFSPVHYKDYYLADGAISSNTPIRVAVRKGARRLIVPATGHASQRRSAVGAVANALHALTLLIARQLVNELENLGPRSNITSFRHCARWWVLLTTSRVPRPHRRAILSTDAWPGA